MTRVIVSRDKLVAIANAIRSKSETTDALTLDEMPIAIENIQVGADVNTVVSDWLMGRVEEVDCDELLEIPSYCFDNKERLKSVRLANAKSCSSYNFRSCVNLEKVDLPSLIGSVGPYFCTSCDLLTDVNIPLVTSLGNYSFRYAYALKFIDLPSVGSIGTYCFATARLLETVILRKSDSIATLGASGSFVGSGIANGTGYIYVPKALIEEYKAGTNWSKYASQFRAIEDYPEITGG